MNNCRITINTSDELTISSLDNSVIYFQDDDTDAEKIRNHLPIMAGG